MGRDLPAEFTYDDISTVCELVADVNGMVTTLAIVLPVLLDSHWRRRKRNLEGTDAALSPDLWLVAGTHRRSDLGRDKIRGCLKQSFPAYCPTSPEGRLNTFIIVLAIQSTQRSFYSPDTLPVVSFTSRLSISIHWTSVPHSHPLRYAIPLQ